MNASSDHEVLFTRLFQNIVKNGNYYAALASKDCPNLKITIRNLIVQFLGFEKELEDENIGQDVLFLYKY